MKKSTNYVRTSNEWVRHVKSSICNVSIFLLKFCTTFYNELTFYNAGCLWSTFGVDKEGLDEVVVKLCHRPAPPDQGVPPVPRVPSFADQGSKSLSNLHQSDQSDYDEWLRWLVITTLHFFDFYLSAFVYFAFITHKNPRSIFWFRPNYLMFYSTRTPRIRYNHLQITKESEKGKEVRQFVLI